jgi:hypothetical protein
VVRRLSVKNLKRDVMTLSSFADAADAMIARIFSQICLDFSMCDRSVADSRVAVLLKRNVAIKRKIALCHRKNFA